MSVVTLRKTGVRLENQLQWPAEKWLLEKGFITAREFNTPWGISDLVGIRPNLVNTTLRIEAGQKNSLGDVTSVMVLVKIPTLLSKRTVTMDDLVTTLGDLIGPTQVVNIVERLIKKKIVVRSSTGRLARDTPWLPFHEQLVSIELKLERIEEALKQAKRHKTMTADSYVGLPLPVAQRVSQSNRINDFKFAGVGLLGIDSAAETCSELLCPDPSLSDTERVYEIAAADRCWSRVLKKIQH